MEIKEYLTVKGESEKLNIIERSKFITYIKGVEDETDAKAFIEQIKKKHSLATHNCYAYIADELGLIQKFSDDGEPQGTAGMPILEVLKNRKIYKTCVVVTRYFGGVKLGAGGLVRAYSGVTALGLDETEILKMTTCTDFKVKAEYDGYSKIIKSVNNIDSVIVDTNFGDGVECLVTVKNDKVDAFLNKLKDVFKGNEQVEKVGERYFSFEKVQNG